MFGLLQSMLLELLYCLIAMQEPGISVYCVPVYKVGYQFIVSLHTMHLLLLLVKKKNKKRKKEGQRVA